MFIQSFVKDDVKLSLKILYIMVSLEICFVVCTRVVPVDCGLLLYSKIVYREFYEIWVIC